ncbi:hypothetical protein BDR07DRAFT_1491357 [Suillus spraguei]|nr:hypothetical protein BDR07DRAFT_1491357 [Suillus spraguei]
MALPNDVMDTTSVETFLASKLLCLEGQPFTLTHLSSILFHITQMSTTTPVPVTAAVRAVVFLLRKHVELCQLLTKWHPNQNPEYPPTNIASNDANVAQRRPTTPIGPPQHPANTKPASLAQQPKSSP